MREAGEPEDCLIIGDRHTEPVPLAADRLVDLSAARQYAADASAEGEAPGGRTVGQMSSDEKHALSHRGKAARAIGTANIDSAARVCPRR